MGHRRFLYRRERQAARFGLPGRSRPRPGRSRRSDRGDPLARRSHPRHGAAGRSLRRSGFLLRQRALPRGVPFHRRRLGGPPFFRRRFRGSGDPRRVRAARGSGVEADICPRQSSVGALEGRPFSGASSGVREIHGVFARLAEAASKPTFALANRRIFSRNGCEIWSLSPDDAAFRRFLKSVGGLLPGVGQTKTRVSSLAPNEAAVALWIGIEDIAVVLGSDLEKPGWAGILESRERPAGVASAFKVPHHGSANADEQEVWKRMLEPASFAVLTPWRRGGRTLPGEDDVRRILSHTGNAYATARTGSLNFTSRHRGRAVDRTIGESGIRLRRLPMSPGWLRLRRPLDSRTSWTVETFGSACHLEKFAA